MTSRTSIPIYLETASKKTIAGAVEWPGWCRSAKDEESALSTILGYAQRYAGVLAGSGLGFIPPGGIDDFEIVERLAGNATTDYGVPGLAPARDDEPFDRAALDFSMRVLEACWAALDRAAAAAEGMPLAKGPRGGGRELEAIIRHVFEADSSYLGQVGYKVKVKLDSEAPWQESLAQVRAATAEALEAGLRGELETVGPRGGKRWTPRYFVRRMAWHCLDHVWEIEDRIEG